MKKDVHNEKNKKIKVKVMERKIKVKNIKMNRTPKIKLNGRYMRINVSNYDGMRYLVRIRGVGDILMGREAEMDVTYFNEVGERSRPRTPNRSNRR